MDPRDPERGYDWYVQTLTIAHEADPQTRLILLDFNNEILCPKSDTMFALAKTLLAKKLPLHGIGFQMHINTDCKRTMWKKQTLEPGGHSLSDDAYFDSLRKNIRRFTDLGLEVWITEMSVDVNPDKPLEAELKRQAEVYGRVFEVCLENRGMKGIKLWGVMDDTDWSTKKNIIRICSTRRAEPNRRSSRSEKRWPTPGMRTEDEPRERPVKTNIPIPVLSVRSKARRLMKHLLAFLAICLSAPASIAALRPSKRADPRESTNLADKPKHAATLVKMKKLAAAHGETFWRAP